MSTQTMAGAVPGMAVHESAAGPRQTMDRLVEAVTSRGMTVMARIDHAGAAAKACMQLAPTELLIFGDPRGGTPLMQAAQTLGIDLPLKALVWEDAEGRTWVGYNEPLWLAERHGVGRALQPRLQAMTSMLDAVTREAASAPSPAT